MNLSTNFVYGTEMLKEIDTERCRLRQLSSIYMEVVLSLYADQKVREYLGGTLEKLEASQRFQKMCAFNPKEEMHWAVILKEKEEFIGLIRVDRHHNGMDYEISYQFLPIYWGQGLAYETVNQAMLNACNMLGINKILAETQSQNLRSIKLLQKLGMKKVKTLVRFGVEQSLYMYRLDVDEKGCG